MEVGSAIVMARSNGGAVRVLRGRVAGGTVQVVGQRVHISTVR